MLAFELTIDEEQPICAGVEDWSILTVHVTASRREEGSTVRDGYIECAVHGMTLPDQENVRYQYLYLVLG